MSTAAQKLTPVAATTGAHQASSVSIQNCTTDLTAVNLKNLPSELRQRNQWVLWRIETRDGKLTKVPYSARTGEKASTTNPKTWSSFDKAVAAYKAGGYDGIGFVFSKDGPYTGVDLDHVRDPVSGEIATWAVQAVIRFATYTEVSQSGTGLHLIVRGKLPGKGRRKKVGSNGQQLEMYDSGRFFVMTGDQLQETSAIISEGQTAVDHLYQTYFGNEEEGPETCPAPSNPVTLPDDELIAKASAAKNGKKFEALWAGNWKGEGYTSQSEADAALLGMLRFWTGGDKDRSVALFGNSGLSREKWKKRKDYRESTWRSVNHGEVYSQHAEPGDLATEGLYDISAMYFDGASYWRKEGDRNYGRLSRKDVELDFGMRGLSAKRSKGLPSEVERELYKLQRENRVTYAGPICGRPAGLMTARNDGILVTRSPDLLTTRPGPWPTIQGLLENLFGRAANDPDWATQMRTFMAWLKLGRFAVQNPEQHKPGHVLALVGPADCGKTLVQANIITPALGGRSADPSLWLTDRTTFNSDLWAAEHLVIGDKGLGEDGRERAHLRDELKRIVAVSEYPLHAKHRDALTLRPIWRVSLSCNDDPESAISLPALDASFSDKIIYLQCLKPPAPFFDEQEPEARSAFAKALQDEMPAFLAEVDAFSIPADLKKGRFGVREFHHPKVIDLIGSTSPLIPISDVLQSWVDSWAAQGQSHFSGPSVDLYSALDLHLGCGLRTVSSSPSNLSHQLGRLAATDSWKGRIIKSHRRIGPRTQNQKQNTWTILPAPVI